MKRREYNEEKAYTHEYDLRDRVIQREICRNEYRLYTERVERLDEAIVVLSD